MQPATRARSRSADSATTWKLRMLLVCVLLGACPASASAATEAKAVSPQTISLPSGPGSIEGLGESFEPQLNTGTAAYGIRFALPPGRVGHAPALGLRYEGGEGNGVAGIGWSLDGAAYLQRQSDKGLPRYDVHDTFVTSAGEELVLLSDGSYRTENEGGFQRFHFDASSDAWTVETPDGGEFVYGVDGSARIADAGRTYRWLLTRAVDANGNAIDYAYTALPGSTHQRFLERVYYTRHVAQSLAGEHVVVLRYDGGRPDPIRDFRPGFELVTAHRLSEVHVCTRGGSFTPASTCDDVGEAGAARVRAYRLRYDEVGSCQASTCQRGLVGAFCSADAECVAGATRLAGVQQIGADSVASLPEETFAYTDYDFSTSPIWSWVSGLPIDDMADPDLAIVDLDADGLPDVLETPAPGSYQLRANRGPQAGGVVSFDAAQAIPGPAGLRLSDPGSALADLDGDGVTDLIAPPSSGGSEFRLHPGTGNGRFSPFSRVFQILGWSSFVDPAAGWDDPSLRFTDLDFDKRIDVVRTVAGAGGAAADLVVRRTDTIDDSDLLRSPTSCGALPDALFQDGKTFLVDMNGDRLLDIVVADTTTSGVQSIRYYPATGRGGFGRLGACGQQGLAVLLGGDPVAGVLGADFASFRDFFWEDLTNDGLADLLWLGGSELHMWVNRGGDTLSHVSLGGYPGGIDFDRCAPGAGCTQDVVHLIDVNGNGTRDVVLIDRNGSRTVRYLDLAGPEGVPAHLLREIRNGLGRVTEIDYAPSTRDYLAARAAGTPWKSRLPFPVPVVARSRVRYGLDLDGVPGEDEIVSEFRYRDGYYDGGEREFRGFSEVETIERGDPSQPTLVTRSSFHTGAPDGVDNDGDGYVDERSAGGGAEEEPLKGLLLESRSETCSNGPDGDCATTGEPFSHDLSRWEVRTLYGSTGTVCSLDSGVACCSDSQCGAAGLGTCMAADDPEPGRLPESACTVGQSVHWAVSTAQRTAVLERGSGPRVDLLKQTDYDDYGNRTAVWDWGVVDAPDLPGFGCQLTSGVCSSDPQALCGSDADCGGPGSCERWSHADAKVCDGDAFAFADASGSADERRDESIWITDADAWQLRCEQEIVVRDGSGTIESHDRYFYDDLPLGSCSSGNRTREEAELIGESRFIPRVRTSHDPFGNPVELLDARDGRRTLDYDEAFATYPTRETVQVQSGALAMTAGYHEGYGVVSSHTSWDFAGEGPVYSYLYDGFGRLVAEIGPGDSAAAPTRTHAYHLNEAGDGVSSVQTRQREASGGGTVDAFAYVDSLGRALGAKQEGDTPGEWIFEGVKAYGRRGEERASWVPYATTSPDWEPSSALDAHTEVVRDATGRERQTIHPDGSRSEIAHRPLLRDLFDEDDTAGITPDAHGSERSDGLDRLVEVVERLDGSELRTRYDYDARGNLLAISDSQGNQTLSAYDSLSRRVLLDDPNRGVLESWFDDSDNLIETRDARGQRIVRSYDAANRLATVNYLDVTGDPASDPIDVTYHYDLPAAGGVPLGDGTVGVATFTAGQLASVEDLSGEEHFSYDARRRLAWSSKQVRDPELGVLLSFTSHFGYDAMDRMVSRRYPDGDELTYGYGPRGLLRQIRGAAGGLRVLDDVAYRPDGQREGLLFGSGVETSYAYDVRQRLEEIHTRGAGDTSGASLLHLRYAFDPASNVTAIDDLRSGVAAGDPRQNSQRLGYDELHRLTSYRLGAPGDTRGGIDYAYDAIGNLLSKNSDIVHDVDGRSVTQLGTLAYGGTLGRFGRIGRGPADPPGPHALTSLEGGARLYAYDANGNLTEHDGMTATWDYEDRLVALEDVRMRVEYVYDHLGRRISKRVLAKTALDGLAPGEARVTLHPERDYEVRDGQPTKFVFLDEVRIAEITGSLDPGAERVERFALHEGWNLISLAVDAADAASQLGIGGTVLDQAWRVGSGATPPEEIAVGDALPAGSVLWVHANAPAVVQIRGHYAPAASVPVPARGFVASGGLEALPVSALAPETTAWRFDAGRARWLGHLPGPLAAISELTGVVVPTAALYVDAALPGEISLPPASARVRFHHGDHLGSSGVVTDGAGRLVEETAYYPYGEPRLRLRGDDFDLPSSNYLYTGKERDFESGLQYFEARYYAAPAGRFTSVDPIRIKPQAIRAPQGLNAYAYSMGNPLRFVDPDGRKPMPASWRQNVWFAETYYEIRNLADNSSATYVRGEGPTLTHVTVKGSDGPSLATLFGRTVASKVTDEIKGKAQENLLHHVGLRPSNNLKHLRITKGIDMVDQAVSAIMTINDNMLYEQWAKMGNAEYKAAKVSLIANLMSDSVHATTNKPKWFSMCRAAGSCGNPAETRLWLKYRISEFEKAQAEVSAQGGFERENPTFTNPPDFIKNE